MKFLTSFEKHLIVAVLVIASVFAIPYWHETALAQATVTQTTTSAAITLTDDAISVASATGFTVGYTVYIDKEAMRVSAISGTRISVVRGLGGTVRTTHQSSAPVLVGPSTYFSNAAPSGSCSAIAEPALPRVVLSTGDVYNCTNSQWTRTRLGSFGSSGEYGFHTYTAAGAITLAPGMHLVNGTTLAMTIAAPTRIMDGMILSVCAANASAHTLTFTGGFGGGGSGEDVGTFSGAAGDCITLRAANSLWFIVGAHQVTVA